jgi:competence protein ComEC
MKVIAMKKRLLTLLPLLLLLLFVINGHGSTVIGPTDGAVQPQPVASPLTVYALDIGQGDSLLIIAPGGKTVLVDAGVPGSGHIILDAMKRYGVDHIDLMVATHAHADHIGGADEVMLQTKVSAVLDSKVPNATKNYEDFLAAIDKTGAKYIAAAPGQSFDLGGNATLAVLAPIQPFFTKDQLRSGANEPNANSVVVRLDYKNFSMLFTGDAEAETEARMIANNANLKAKVLKVGHHGSRYATSEAFLQAVHPEAAIISVGADNRYSHPTQETLDRLKAAGVKVYRTDLNGEIKITSDGSSYQIDTQKTAPLTAIFVGRTTSGGTAKGDSTEPAGTTEPTQEATSKPTQSNAQQSNSSEQIVGNKNSKKYHFPGCPSYDSVSEKNLVVFKSAAEAEAAGYTLAGNCHKTDSKPSTSDVKPTTVPKIPAKPVSEVEQTQQTKQATTTAVTQTEKVIGNKDSKIYQLPGCSGYDKVSEKNRVYFDSQEKAEAAGYRIAKNCYPSKQSSSSTDAKPATTTATTPTTGKPASDDTDSTSTTTSNATQPPVIGNKNSKIYHLLGCPGYKTVSDKNRVAFQSAEEAEAAGYKRAGNCHK